MRARIVVVSAHKGGCGKSTLSAEIASGLGGVIIDSDPMGGNLSSAHGYGNLGHDPLADALQRGPGGAPPRLYGRKGSKRPPIAPCHEDFGLSDFTPEEVGDCILHWASVWGEAGIPVAVIDTRPGQSSFSEGAQEVADLIVIPFQWEIKPVNGLFELVESLGGEKAVMAVANRVPPRRVPPHLSARVARLAQDHPELLIGPRISDYTFLASRCRDYPILQWPKSRDSRLAKEELIGLCTFIAEVLGARGTDECDDIDTAAAA